MKINEIFYSIQGESSFAGRPCIFVRTTFCNLRCTYCDTTQAYYNGQDYSIAEIIDELEKYPCKLVELTGGEPLLQAQINDLAKLLLKMGYTVLCESSGSQNIDKIDKRVHRIIDIKTPDSGEADKNLWSNIDKLTERDEIKFVICSKEDYEWSKAIVEKFKLVKNNTVLFSPVFESLKNKDLAEWIIKDGLEVRFQLQLHKYIWKADQVGV